MSKPQWLKDAEKKKMQVHREPDYCHTCQHYGEFVKFTKHKGKERVEVHRCAINPKCLNTKYSICCEAYLANT